MTFPRRAIFCLSTLALTVPAFAYAAIDADSTGLRAAGNIAGYSSLCSGAASVCIATFIGRVVNVAFAFAAIVLFAYLLWAGFIWMTAGGEGKKVEEAKQMLKNTVVGLFIMGTAFSATNFVMSQFTSVLTSGGGGGGGSNTASDQTQQVTQSTLAACVQQAISRGTIAQQDALTRTNAQWTCRQATSDEVTNNTCVTHGCPSDSSPTFLCCPPVQQPGGGSGNLATCVQTAVDSHGTNPPAITADLAAARTNPSWTCRTTDPVTDVVQGVDQTLSAADMSTVTCIRHGCSGTQFCCEAQANVTALNSVYENCVIHTQIALTPGVSLTANDVQTDNPTISEVAYAACANNLYDTSPANYLAGIAAYRSSSCSNIPEFSFLYNCLGTHTDEAQGGPWHQACLNAWNYNCQSTCVERPLTQAEWNQALTYAHVPNVGSTLACPSCMDSCVNGATSNASPAFSSSMRDAASCTANPTLGCQYYCTGAVAGADGSVNHDCNNGVMTP